MTKGTLVIAGLGPGQDTLITPEVTEALAMATDVIGYQKGNDLG